MTDKPTREQILVEPAGRQMDAWVAEWVMEWKVTDDKLFAFSHNTKKGYMLGQHADIAFVETFMPSSDIAAAWQVVEKLTANEWSSQFEFNKFCWWILFFRIDPVLPEEISEGVGEADTAPLAICRAALLAVLEDGL